MQALETNLVSSWSMSLSALSCYISFVRLILSRLVQSNMQTNGNEIIYCRLLDLHSVRGRDKGEGGFVWE